ncbi:hypothetical protein Gorai_009521 [Gossypium raimondii]|uniref:Uncharacterized protein n=1 Tax=Gossypium raimondii TaxID=29730 RepID=A0A7J8PTC1_GOSRA|nr:hypothetical protein [Gossypium raimondii]
MVSTTLMENCMKAFIKFLEEKAQRAVIASWEPITLDVNGVGMPKPQIIWAIEEDKLTHVNFKALNDIFNSVDPHEFTEYENTNYLGSLDHT